MADSCEQLEGKSQAELLREYNELQRKLRKMKAQAATARETPPTHQQSEGI